MNDERYNNDKPSRPDRRAFGMQVIGGGVGAALGVEVAASETVPDPVRATIALKKAISSLVGPFLGMKRKDYACRTTFPDKMGNNGPHGLENDIYDHLREIKRVRDHLPVGLIVEDNASPSIADIKLALHAIHPELLSDEEIGALLGGKNLGVFKDVLTELADVDALNVPIKDIPTLLERITVDRLRPLVGIGSSLETRGKVYNAVSSRMFDVICHNGGEGAEVLKSVMHHLGKDHYVSAAEVLAKTYVRKEALRAGEEDPFPEMGPLRDENDSIKVYDLGEEEGQGLFQIHLPEGDVEQWLVNSFGESAVSSVEIYTPYEGASHYVQISGAVAETLRHMAENNRAVPYKAVEIDGERMRPDGMGRDATSFYQHEGRVSAHSQKFNTV